MYELIPKYSAIAKKTRLNHEQLVRMIIADKMIFEKKTYLQKCFTTKKLH